MKSRQPAMPPGLKISRKSVHLLLLAPRKETHPADDYKSVVDARPVRGATSIGIYRENAIAVRVIDRSAYDATSRVHAHRQRKNLSYLRNGCCIYYLRPSGSAHL